jgi:hypothetical protein
MRSINRLLIVLMVVTGCIFLLSTSLFAQHRKQTARQSQGQQTEVVRNLLRESIDATSAGRPAIPRIIAIRREAEQLSLQVQRAAPEQRMQIDDRAAGLLRELRTLTLPQKPVLIRENKPNPALARTRSYTLAELSTLRPGDAKDSDFVQMTVAELKAMTRPEFRVGNSNEPSDIAKRLLMFYRPKPAPENKPVAVSNEQKPAPDVPVTQAPSTPTLDMQYIDVLTGTNVLTIRNLGAGSPHRAEFIIIEKQLNGTGPFIQIDRIAIKGAKEGLTYSDEKSREHVGIPTYYRVRAGNKV